MTRELKFRAWHKEKGMVTNPMSMSTIVARFIREFRSSPTGFGNRPQEYEVKPDEYTLLQFTGLKDKNGVEIYEGDIVKVYDTNRSVDCEKEDLDDDHDIEKCIECEEEMYVCTQKVEFRNCGYYCDEELGDFCPPLSEDYLQLKVVGNIYQNPELLK